MRRARASIAGAARRASTRRPGLSRARADDSFRRTMKRAATWLALSLVGCGAAAEPASEPPAVVVPAATAAAVEQIEPDPMKATTPAELTWERGEAEAVARATKEARPLLVEFAADWCMACKELEKQTWADPRVKRGAARFVAVRIDATNDEDPQVKALSAKYRVVGLPTIVVFDAEGKERRRVNEFVTAEALLAALATIR